MSVQYIRMIGNNQTELMTLANMLVSHSRVQQGFKHHFICHHSYKLLWCKIFCLKLCFNLCGIAKLHLSGSYSDGI